jgi:hypothetical protein
MDKEMLEAIERYAQVPRGHIEPELRDAAIAAHQYLMGRHQEEYYQKTKHYWFMREIDNPVPDLAMRAKYREELLKEIMKSEVRCKRCTRKYNSNEEGWRGLCDECSLEAATEE